MSDASARGRIGRSTTAVLILLPLLCAIAGAVITPAPRDSFRSQAVVSIQGDPSASIRRAEWQTFSEGLSLPPVRAALSALAGRPVSSDAVHAVGRPDVPFVRVRASANQQRLATALANAATAKTISVLRGVNAPGSPQGAVAVRFDFASGRDDFDRGVSRFNLVPAAITAVASGGQRNAFLRARCLRGPGCGPYVSVERSFSERSTYRATGYVRSSEPISLRLVLGANARDVAAGPATKVAGQWKRVTVLWKPRRPVTTVELGFQTVDGGPATFGVDSLLLADASRRKVGDRAIRDAAARVALERARTDNRYAVLSEARPIERAPAPTALATFLGALIGLAAAGAGLLAARAARRRGEA